MSPDLIEFRIELRHRVGEHEHVLAESFILGIEMQKKMNTHLSDKQIVANCFEKLRDKLEEVIDE